ncbi:unnamed protein product [Polarella glacialis]|uniref:Deacetylase sirtuin-type domain-containing protein n=1 Tax=Polarella glacialis TaxID=89957 RepID=A0A813G9I8_POLGL|nr:unnamed protein product [Polarella glacialis]
MSMTGQRPVLVFADLGALLQSLAGSVPGLWPAIVRGGQEEFQCEPAGDPKEEPSQAKAFAVSVLAEDESDSRLNLVSEALRAGLRDLGLRAVTQQYAFSGVQFSSELVLVQLCCRQGGESQPELAWETDCPKETLRVLVLSEGATRQVCIEGHTWQLCSGEGQNCRPGTSGGQGTAGTAGIAGTAGTVAGRTIGLVPGSGALLYADGNVEALMRPVLLFDASDSTAPTDPSTASATEGPRRQLLQPSGNCGKLPLGLSAATSPMDVAARWLAESGGKVLAFTGAGISAESGVPTYRDAGGLWLRYNQMEVSSLPGFVRDPAKIWAFERDFFQLLDGVQPNAGHKALVELECKGLLSSVVTQNVDGLHQAAGSRVVCEVHGSEVHAICLRKGCGRRCELAGVFAADALWGTEDPELRAELKAQLHELQQKCRPGRSSPTDSSEASSEGQSLPSLPSCALDSSSSSSASAPSSSRSNGVFSPKMPSPRETLEDSLFKVPLCPFCKRGILKPDGVYFGEPLSRKVLLRSLRFAAEAKVVLLVGTNGNVDPARRLPLLAKRAQGARIIEVNPKSTALSKHADLRLMGPSAELLPELVRRTLGSQYAQVT